MSGHDGPGAEGTREAEVRDMIWTILSCISTWTYLVYCFQVEVYAFFVPVDPYLWVAIDDW
jgi:hypothetical protein